MHILYCIHIGSPAEETAKQEKRRETAEGDNEKIKEGCLRQEEEAEETVNQSLLTLLMKVSLRRLKGPATRPK